MDVERRRQPGELIVEMVVQYEHNRPSCDGSVDEETEIENGTMVVRMKCDRCGACRVTGLS